MATTVNAVRFSDGEKTDAENFYYVCSCDIKEQISIKIGTLEGKQERQSYKELIKDPQLKFSGLYQSSCPDLYVTCSVYADGVPLYMPIQTSYKAFTTRWNWNEWLRLPVKYQDLPRTAVVAFTIWDIYDTTRANPVGGSTISLFGKYGTLRRGVHDLRVWPGVEGDGNMPTSTPGKPDASAGDDMTRLAKLSQKHHTDRMLKVDWLDRLTFREIEMVNEKEKRTSNFMYIMIEFPHIIQNGIEYAVVYFEKGADEIEYFKIYPEVVNIPDSEVLQENMVESKHHRLARSFRSGTVSRDMKPNASTRDQLNVIVNYPSTTILSSEEKDLLWKFRVYLSSQKKALTKFLKSVNWNQSHESRQAIDLMHKWDPIDTVDALELLTPYFTNKSVRQYAVARLKQASDEDLLLYLLQLVQALRYEPQIETQMSQDYQNVEENSDADSSSNKETEDSNMITSSTGEGQFGDPLSGIELSDSTRRDSDVLNESSNSSFAFDKGNDELDLASFLVSKACTNDKIANFFYWYLLVECKDGRDKKVTEMYVNVMREFSKALLTGGHDNRKRRTMLGREQNFLKKITDVAKTIHQYSGNRKRKIERLRSLLDTPEYVSFDPLPLALDSDIKVKGIVPHKVSMFKSALMPIRFCFRTIQNKDYVAIFKNGDDLRQDQLILQIITLMDKLLMRENLDLKLTPYNVLATSSTQGFVQYIESTSVAEILSADGSIQNFFRKYNPSESAPYGVNPDVMDTYVKSCAGYCVITYLLGVGDRHLDNLLLTKSGKLFHIDFGYILGRDPKPFPPPMKLSKEMVEGMGGTASDHYQDFRKQCYTAFLHLRRYSSLVLNLFALMVDANVPDIAIEPDKTVKKVQDKFRLDLSDEEAVQYLQSLIDESVSAVFATVVEQIHKWAQYWRK